jgi:A/G-specific adenine glycosylase
MNHTLYFKQKLVSWHQNENKRELPWKGEKDVYRIWLSEIILQQTRAAQGLKYYERFLKLYPTIQKLAAAPLDEVFKLWEGLGYYNRCRNLHATANTIVNELSGKFPSTYEGILKLKGVGPYTAAAIASFGFNLPHAVVDGNVYRVLARFFGITEPSDSTKGKKIFQQLAQDCLAQNEPAVYNQAIMDFGATVCKPDNPLCSKCPLQKKCVASAQDKIAHYPVKEKKLTVKSRWFSFWILECNGKFAVRKRTGKDVWANLYEFPNAEWSSEKLWKKAGENELVTWLQNHHIQNRHIIKTISKPFRQQLTHQTIHAKAVITQLSGKEPNIGMGFEWRSKTRLKSIPFPRLMNEMMEKGILELF